MIRLPDPRATHEAGRKLGTEIQCGDVIALSGALGAGKTSLTRGMLEGLGLIGVEVPSPSFALVIPYDPPFVRLPVAHVDLYRIDDPAEVDALALDDQLLDGALIIEWPERLGSRLWDHALWISIETDPNGGRILTARVPPSWEGRWPY